MENEGLGPATPGTAARCGRCALEVHTDTYAPPDPACWGDHDLECYTRGYERLKAENASLLESLRAAERERDKARGDLRSLMPVRGACKASETMEWASGPDGFSDAVCRACGWRGGILADGRIFAHLPPLPDPALAAAEQRAEAAEKRATDLRDALDDVLRMCRAEPEIAEALGGEVVSHARAALHDEERPQEEVPLTEEK